MPSLESLVSFSMVSEVLSCLGIENFELLFGSEVTFVLEADFLVGDRLDVSFPAKKIHSHIFCLTSTLRK